MPIRTVFVHPVTYVAVPNLYVCMYALQQGRMAVAVVWRLNYKSNQIKSMFFITEYMCVIYVNVACNPRYSYEWS